MEGFIQKMNQLHLSIHGTLKESEDFDRKKILNSVADHTQSMQFYSKFMMESCMVLLKREQQRENSRSTAESGEKLEDHLEIERKKAGTSSLDKRERPPDFFLHE